jgi:hypothetical protein
VITNENTDLFIYIYIGSSLNNINMYIYSFSQDKNVLKDFMVGLGDARLTGGPSYRIRISWRIRHIPDAPLGEGKR